MKKIVLLALVAMFAFVAKSFAWSVGDTFQGYSSSGEMTFKITAINGDNYEVSVGDGSSASINFDYSSPIVIPLSVRLPSSSPAIFCKVTSIASFAFSGCYSLPSVTFHGGLTSIGDRAFAGCESLTTLDIPQSVMTIGEDAFLGCRSLTSLSFCSTTTIINNPVVSWSSLESITIEKIQDQQDLYYGSGLQLNAIIKNDVLIAGCKNTIIPAGVKTIGEDAFYGCSGLTEISIPGTVQTIKERAFGGCYSLTTVKAGMTTPPEIPSLAFPNAANATLYVPAGCTAAYQTATGWEEFGRILEGVTINECAGGSIIIPWGLDQMKCLATTERIGDTDWTAENFDDSGWATLTGPINDDGDVTATLYYYLRRTFELTQVDQDGYYFFVNFSDNTRYGAHGTLQVYVNGTKVVDRSHYADSYSIHIPAYVFKKGANTLAIFFTDRDGKATFDFSLAKGTLYFLRNVETGKFLSRGENMTAVLSDLPLPVQVNKKQYNSYSFFFPAGSENQKKLWSINYNSHFRDVFVHYNGQSNGNAEWVVNFVNSDEDIFNIQAGGVLGDFLGAVSGEEEDNNLYANVTNDEGYIQWQLVPEGPWTAAQRERWRSLKIQADKMNIKDDFIWKDEYTYTEVEDQIFRLEKFINEGIVFKDETVEAICLRYWDLDNDGVLTRQEAHKVKSLGKNSRYFQYKNIESFDELQFFTGLESIENYDFQYCNKLKSIILPPSVTSIGKQAFYQCTSLESVVLPEGVTSIGESAFYKCTSLESIVLRNGLTSIGNNAFYNCAGLQSVGLPTSLISIGSGAFYGCTSLESIQLPYSLKQIGENVYSDGAFSHSGLKSIKFPSRLELIGHSTFRGCASLTQIDFSNCSRELTVSHKAFAECTALEEVDIPSKIMLSGDDIFYNCDKLRKITFASGNPSTGLYHTFAVDNAHSSSLEEAVLPSAAIMGGSFFWNCDKLEKVTFLQGDAGTQHIVQNFDPAVRNITFTVPDGSAESFLKRGYKYVSDLSGLNLVKEEARREMNRVREMASSLYEMDAIDQMTYNLVVARVDTYYTQIEVTDDYEYLYNMIDLIKGIGKNDLIAKNSANLPEGFDVTGATIFNPDFYNYDIGWNIGRIGTSIGWKGGVTYANGDLQITNFLQASRLDGGKLQDGQFSQIIQSLPAGKYRLTANAIACKVDAAAEQTGIFLFAADQRTPVVTEPETPEKFEVEFTNLIKQDVEIGLRVDQQANALMAVVDDFHLYYEGPITVDDVTLGDVNGDGKVTPADAIMILYHYFNVEQNGFIAVAADLNDDDTITPADAIQALYIYFGAGSGARATRPAADGRDPE